MPREGILLVEKRGPVALLTLNRPEKMNALSQPLVAALQEKLDELETDDSVRAIVLTGAGRAFSAGFDLSETRDAPTKGVAAWRQRLGNDVKLSLKLWDHSKPIVAAVNGFCLGGGLDVALMCDITLAAESAVLGEPEIRFGSGVVTLILPWVLGMKKTRELLYTGRHVTATEALDIGLVNDVVPDEELLTRALRLAREMSVIDPLALKLTKHAINRTYEIMGLREALMYNFEVDVQIEVAETPERREFNQIVREQGVAAAVRWREERFKQGHRSRRLKRNLKRHLWRRRGDHGFCPPIKNV